jgi:hypothetical protein
MGIRACWWRYCLLSVWRVCFGVPVGIFGFRVPVAPLFVIAFVGCGVVGFRSLGVVCVGVWAACCGCGGSTGFCPAGVEARLVVVTFGGFAWFWRFGGLLAGGGMLVCCGLFCLSYVSVLSVVDWCLLFTGVGVDSVGSPLVVFGVVASRWIGVCGEGCVLGCRLGGGGMSLCGGGSLVVCA